MTKAAWSKIPPADQKTIKAACLKLQRRLEVEVPRQDTTAVAEMQKRGLKVNAVNGASAAEFRASAERFASGMKGVRVPPEILEMARRERDAFRARSGGAH
jgi:TRAP-type C4-dicarboxylate transport system substrate-binding protein